MWKHLSRTEFQQIGDLGNLRILKVKIKNYLYFNLFSYIFIQKYNVESQEKACKCLWWCKLYCLVHTSETDGTHVTLHLRVTHFNYIDFKLRKL